MRRTGLILGLIFSVALVLSGCSRTAEERSEQQQAAMEAQGQLPGDLIKVTGCLTAAPDRNAFVVTADRHALTSSTLTATQGETPTFTYELTGDTSNLSAHAGQLVEVTGRLDDSRKDEVDVDDKSEAKLPSVRSGNETVTPAIETETDVEISVRRLHVSSVASTGRDCLQGRRQFLDCGWVEPERQAFSLHNRDVCGTARSSFGLALICGTLISLSACRRELVGHPELEAILARERAPTSAVPAAVWQDARAFYDRRQRALAWVSAKAPTKTTTRGARGSSGRRRSWPQPCGLRRARAACTLTRRSCNGGREDPERAQALAALDVSITTSLLQLMRDVATGRLSPKASTRGGIPVATRPTTSRPSSSRVRKVSKRFSSEWHRAIPSIEDYAKRFARCEARRRSAGRQSLARS